MNIFNFNVEVEEQVIFLKSTTRMSLQTFNLNTIPGPQKHTGHQIISPTYRNTQNRALIMRQGLTIHRKAFSIAIAYLFFSDGDPRPPRPLGAIKG